MSTNEGEVPIPTPPPAPEGSRGRFSWVIDLIKVLALPLVTLVLGYWFNSSLNERQQIDNNVRLYAEMMGRREEADSNLRKDMFNSILNTFMAKDPKTVEAFVKVSLRALDYTYKNVDEAAGYAAKYTETPKALLKEQLTLAIELMDTAEAKKDGYGVMTKEKWASTQKLQLEYGGQKQAVPDEKLWTNKFIK